MILTETIPVVGRSTQKPNAMCKFSNFRCKLVSFTAGIVRDLDAAPQTVAFGYHATLLVIYTIPAPVGEVKIGVD